MDKITALLEKLRGQRVYFDTNPLIYFFDKNQDYLSVVAPLLIAADRGEIFGYTGDAAVSELMVHPYKSNNASEIARGKAFFARKNFLTVLAHDHTIFDTTAQLRAQNGLRMIDGLHFATALRAGCRFFVTNDAHFKMSGTDASLQIIRIADFK